jgi:menaquinone-9 beta-reductase
MSESEFTGIGKHLEQKKWGQGVVSCRTKTDVFVVGGGPAGLAAAIAARGRGMSVTLADGSEPPIDKACGEGLMPESMQALTKLGVKIQPGAGYLFRGISFLHPDAQVAGELSQGPGLGIRRTILHQWLIDCAEQCGVRLLWKTPVAGMTRDGVQLPREFVSARWIIGADGSGSRVRRWIGLDSAARLRQRYASRRHYRIRPWSEYVQFYWGDRAQAYVTPIGNEELCIVIMAENPGAATFDSFFKDYPQLAAQLGTAPLVSRERGAVTLMHSLRAVHSGNVALVGDASGGVDAITGEGLRIAFLQAIAVADAIERSDLSSYARVHRQLARKPMLMGDLLLTLGRNNGLRRRVIRMFANRPQLFSRLLEMHTGSPALGNWLSAGANFGWRFLTT